MRRFPLPVLWLLLLASMFSGPSWGAELNWDKASPQTVNILENGGTQVYVLQLYLTSSNNYPRNLGTSVSILPSAGSVALGQSSGTLPSYVYVYYTPPADFAGSVSFQVRASTGSYFIPPFGPTSLPPPDAFMNVVVNVLQVNDAPSFSLAASHTSTEDGGAQAVPGFAGGFNPGGSGYESGQAILKYIVTSANPDMFTAGGQPAIDNSGTLTYTPAPNRAGSTTISVQVQDNGGIANGGADTSVTPLVSTINITPVADLRLYATAAGGGDGSSWASPFTLRQAMAYSTTGEDIWVKRGVHVPGTLRTDSFDLKTGVKVYGGFAGAEVLLSGRDVGANPTILSGEIGIAGNSDNALHVVRASGDGTLDGFTITGGNANTSGVDSWGGGLVAYGTNPTVQRCVFVGNVGIQVGGGFAAVSSSAASFTDCVVTGNSSRYGGGFYISGGATVTDCVIQGNSATTSGGAFYTDGALTMNHCTVSGNSAPAGTAAITLNGNFTMTNSIVWGNSPSSFIANYGTSSANSSIVQGGLPSGVTGAVSSADPLFANPADPDGPDNLWGTGDDGLMPQALSPARDAGAASSLANDLRGSERPSGPAPDLGAYERRVVYVVPGGTGNGTSWAAAEGDLRIMLAKAKASDEVWVKAGTYRPTVGANRNLSFPLPALVGLYGGFNGTETVRDARDWTANRVILSGDIGTAGDASDNTYSVLAGTGAGSVIDGFIVRGGNANAGGLGLHDGGGGLYLTNASTTVRNCVFDGNAAGYAGGAIFCQGNGTAQIENSLFIGNSSASVGGAIEVEESGAAVTVANSTFVGNTAPYGSVLETYNTNVASSVVNSILWSSGPLLHASGVAPTITYSVVQGGAAGTGNVGTNPQFFNPADPDGADNLLFTADDGLQLLTGSPAANTGLLSASPAKDIRRKSRPLGTGVDMGCYEGQIGRVGFASATSSFSEAAGTVQVAVNLAGAAAEPLTVNWSIDGGTATNGVGIGTGTGIWDFPLFTYYHDSRTTSLYYASELGAASTFRSLTLDVTGLPVQPMSNFTVRLKHTGLADLSQPDWGDGSGWTTVYQGDVTLSATGPLTLVFGSGSLAGDDGVTGFGYNGASNLLVDVSINNSYWTSPPGYVHFTSSPVVRSLYYNTDSGFGNDPLAWIGTGNGSTIPAPQQFAGFPNIVFSPDSVGTRADYMAPVGGTITFAPGETSKVIPITIIQDPNDEDDQTITMSLSAPSGGLLDAITGHTLTIQDDDASPTVQFASAASSGPESSPSPSMTVTLSAQSDLQVTVNYAKAGGGSGGTADITAGGGSDGQLQPGTLTFPPGTVSATVPAVGSTFAIIEDDRDESDETAVIALSAPTRASLGSTSAHTYTVVDNDTSALLLSTAMLSVTEGDPTAQTFTVRLATRPHEPGGLVRIDFSCSNSAEAEVSSDGSAWGATASIWLSATGTGDGLASGTPAAWNTPFTMRVHSVDDTAVPLDDGDVASTLTVAVNAGGTTDSRYAALGASVIDLTTIDNDTPGIIVEPYQSPAPAGVPPLPAIEQYLYRYAAQVVGNVVTVNDGYSIGVPNTNLVVPGMVVYDFWTGNETTVQSVDHGTHEVTLDGPVTQGQYLAFGYVNKVRIRLATKPTASVKIDFAVDDPAVASLGQSSLTIDPANWQLGVVAYFYPGYDDVDQDADGDQTNDFRDTNLTIKNGGSGDPSYASINPPDITFRLYDEDVRGLIFDTSSVSLVEGGAATTYGIRLATVPNATVTVAPQVLGGQAGVSGSVTFSAADWNTWKYVTVTATDDDDYDPSATDTIAHVVTGGEYAGIAGGTVGIAFAGDNDDPSPVVTPTSGLITDEDGATASFQVSLGSRPGVGETVEIPFSTSDAAEGTFLPSGTASQSVFFSRDGSGLADGSSLANAAVWNDPVTVTIIGIDDGALIDGDIAYSIDGGLTISDLVGSPLGGRNTPDVSVINRDNEKAGVRILNSPVSVTEGGAAGQYQLSLQWLGTDPPVGFNVVEVQLASSSPDITFSPSTVVWYGLPADGTFTASKTVFVTAVDDSIAESLETGIAISHTVVSTTDTTRFPTNLQIPDARVSVADNDVAGVEVSPVSITTVEGGVPGVVSLKLKTQPVGTVTIGLSLAGDTDEVTLGASSVSFTASDWNTLKTVSIDPSNDDDTADGNRSYTVVTAAATVTNATADAAYNGLGVADVNGINIDDDAIGVSVSKTALALGEGGGAVSPVTDSYQVRLQSSPTGTVSLVLDGAAQVTFSIPAQFPTQPATAASTVYFASGAGAGDGTGRNSGNPRQWDQNLTITATAIPDLVVEATTHQAVISHTVGGADYAGVSVPSIIATITDAPLTTAFQVGLDVLPAGTITATEGASSSTCSVRLKSKPTSSVTVALATADTAIATASVPSRVFTPANWSTYQTFTIAGIEDQIDQDVDGNQANDKRSTTLTLSTDSTDPAYDALSPVVKAVDVADNDAAGVVIAPLTALQVNEAGSTATFTMVLAKQPRGTVTVPLTVSNPLRGGISSDFLTFTPANWSTPQVVTVTGRDQDLSNDAADGSTTFLVQTGDPTAPNPGGDSAYDLLTAGNVPDITVSILPSNAAPKVAAQANLAIAEDAVTPITVSGINSGQLGELQLVTFSAVSSNPALIPDPQASPVLLTSVATDADLSRLMVLTPALNAFGSTVITVTVIDDASILSDAARSTTMQFTVNVAAVNDPPLVAVDGSTVPVHTEGGAATPVLASLQLTDADSAAISSAQVVITNAQDGSTEILQADGAGTSIIPAYDAATRTLTLTAPVPQPIADFQTVLRTVAYRTASDQPTVSPVRVIQVTVHDGSDPSAPVTAQVAVARSNDPPVLSGTVDPLPSIAEDIADASNVGIKIDQILAGTVVVGDPDGPQLGLAVTGTGGTVAGTWQFSRNSGTTWTALPDFSTGNLPLLADGAGANRIRFVPDPHANGTVEISFRAWDRMGGGSEGVAVVPVAPGSGTSPFSSATLTATLAVTAVNDAPVLASAGTFPAIDEDSATHTGASVANLLAGLVTDIDAGALPGMAVTAADNTNGTWQYSLDSGTSWLAFGPVAPGTATVLAADGGVSRIRYLPAADSHASASISWKAWDRSDGLATGTSGVDAGTGGGILPFSSNAVTATQTVIAVNDAPLLSGLSGSPVILSILEDVPDASNPGVDVAAAIAAISGGDVDTGALQGLAVVSVAAGAGTWQYTMDGGATWDDFGTPDPANARLLTDSGLNRIRLRPALDFTGTADIVVELWDETTGSDGAVANASVNGGTTAFSSSTATLQINVAPANDPPSIDLNLTNGATRDMTSPASYDEGSAAQVVTNSGVSVTDIDSIALSGGTIVLLDHPDGAAEVLDVNRSGLAITPVWNPATWTLTLTSDNATTSPAEYQQLLTTLTYRNTSETPTESVRHIQVTLIDDGLASSSAEALIQVNSKNDLPVLSVGGRRTLALGDALAISDTGEDLDLDGVLDPGEDADLDGELDKLIIQATDADNLPTDLVFTVQLRPNLGKLYKNGGLTVLNNGDTFTIAELHAGLEYRHDGLLAGVDGFAIKVSDGAGGEAIGVVTLTVLGSVPPQVVINDATPALWIEDVTPPVRLDAGALVTDTDSGNFGGGNIIVANPGGRVGDQIDFDPNLVGNVIVRDTVDPTHLMAVISGVQVHVGTISGGIDNNPLVIGLTPSCTPGIAQTLLRGLTWINGGNNPGADPDAQESRVLTITVNDGGISGLTSVPQTRTITVDPIDDPPDLLPVTISLTPGLTVSGQLEAIDPEGELVTFAPGTLQAANGVVTLQADGSFTYEHQILGSTSDAFGVVVTEAGIGGQSVIGTVNVVVTQPDAAAPRITSAAPVRAEPGVIFTYTPVLAGFGTDVEYVLMPSLQEAVAGTPVTFGWNFTAGLSGNGATGTLRINAPVAPPGGYVRTGILVIDRVTGKSAYQPILFKIAVGVSG